VTWVMWNLVLIYLDIVFVSVQDRCMDCAKCTIGLEIILEEVDGTPRCYCWSKIGAQLASNVPLGQKSFWTHLMVHQVDGAQVEACFGPFEDSVNLDAR
jgi:hypothetical protein